ncbi:MAG: DCC1-like thiol-disulfide oxidoreductase family protein, partial [Saprospiraceae bacterium]|nr:DCC1-like thiol-disulfide oxidoreductase family protein [Saprospiraceae bacterium]
MSQKIIFYDGECPLCSRAVIYFLKIDKNEVLRYAPLEGETAKEKMGDEYDEIIKRDTVVYYDGDTFYFETKALI